MPGTRLQYIDGKLQYGGGKEAGVLGQTYNVYRLSSSVQNTLSSSRPVIAGFAAVPDRAKKIDVENDIFNLVAFEMACDNRRLKIGDLAVQYGYRNDGSVFYVAQMRPGHPTIWMRADQAASLSRPFTQAGAAASNVGTGAIPAPDGTWGGTSKDIEQILTLQNGMYAFSSEPDVTSATVYVGYQPRARLKDSQHPKIPYVGPIATALYREEYVFYLPLLPGEQLNEEDRISLGNSDRYQVAQIFSTELTGLSGTICICEKLPT